MWSELLAVPSTSTSSTAVPTPDPRDVFRSQIYEIPAIPSVAPSANELQFINYIVRFGSGGNIPETKKTFKNRIARILMTLPNLLPRKNAGRWPRVP